MRFFPHIHTFFILCLFSFNLIAQSSYDQTIERYVNEHNARVAMQNWAKVERAPVILAINEHNELEAFIDNDRRLRVTLQREAVSDMDKIFPRTITSAIIIMTNETAIIIDPAEQVHFALSLFAEPRLPQIAGEPTLVFEGSGLGRHWSGDM